ARWVAGPTSIWPFDDYVPALHVAKVQQALWEAALNTRVSRHDQEPDSEWRSRLLPLDGDRRRERPGQRGQQEAAAVHAGMVRRLTDQVKRVTGGCRSGLPPNHRRNNSPLDPDLSSSPQRRRLVFKPAFSF